MKPLNQIRAKKLKQENYLFLKEKYFDLIVFFTKRKKESEVKQLQEWWAEIDKKYKEELKIAEIKF